MTDKRKGAKRQLAAGNWPLTTELRSLAGEFFEWMAFTHYSPNTIKNRKVYLDYFFSWCEERGLESPQEITKPIIERYQRYLFNYKKKRDEQPLSIRSQHSRLVPVRAFFKFLARRNYILYNPAADIDMPRLGHRLPRNVLTISEAEQVLAVPRVDTVFGLRDRAILEVFYSTGMRRAELMRLGIYDIDRERGTLFIREGKGRKDRMIPIGERALKWIDKYMFEIRPQLVVPPDDNVLFLTDHGDVFTPGRLTQMVREYVDTADIGKKGSCHLFRHTMATLMLEHGADIRFIQQILGHAKLETTQIYTQISIRQLKDIHTATHPARLDSKRSEAVRKELEDELAEDQDEDEELPPKKPEN